MPLYYICNMSRQSKFKIKEDLAELQGLLKKQTSLSGEKRIKCLIFMKEKRFSTRSQLSQYLGVHKRTIERWLKKYAANGVDFMVQNQSKPKDPQYITEEIHNGLASRVTNSCNPFLGYRDAQQWVKSEYGVDINYHTLRYHLIKHFGTKPKTPRKSHIKKEGQAIEAFFKTT